MGSHDERAARNESLFREANDKIARNREELGVDEPRSPFFCECGRPACSQVIVLSHDEYREVRANPKRFVVARGHAGDHEDVVAEHGSYVVVEKRGDAARAAVADRRRGTR